MTAKSKIEKVAKPFPADTLVFGLMSAFFLIMILKNSAIAIEYMQTGLRLCAASVIPSLFPFMVISELVTASGLGEAVAKIAGKPLHRLLGISPESSSALLLGSICGFPVGAKVAMSLYDRGVISAKEAERLLAICNIPSSGFLISAVGISLYGNPSFGLFLYLAALTSLLLWGVILARVRPLSRGEACASEHSRRPLGIDTFTGAISSATSSMLSVCSYVVFFTSVIGCLSHMLDALSLPSAVRALLFGVFEISSGVNAAASLEGEAVSVALCGFIIGWSGISVHFQILSLCGGRRLSFTPYLIAKLFQGVFCGTACFLFQRYAPANIVLVGHDVSTLAITSERYRYTVAVCLIFLFCLLIHYRGCHRKTNG